MALSLMLALAAAAALLWAAWPAPLGRQTYQLQAGAPALAGSGPATRLTGGGLAIEVEAPRRLRGGEAGRACVRVGRLPVSGAAPALEGLPPGTPLALLIELHASGAQIDPPAEQGGPLPQDEPVAACWSVRLRGPGPAELEFGLRLRALTPAGADEWLFWRAAQRVERASVLGLNQTAAAVVGAAGAALALALRLTAQERDHRWSRPRRRSRS